MHCCLAGACPAGGVENKALTPASEGPSNRIQLVDELPCRMLLARLRVCNRIVTHHGLRAHSISSRDSDDWQHASLNTNHDIPKDARHVIIAGAGINVVLGVGKFAAGTAACSPALIADGVHSLTDIVSDIVTYATMKVSRLPADSNHLFGHGRMEPIGTLAVATLLVGASCAVAVHSYDGLMSVLPLLPTEAGPLPIASFREVALNHPEGIAAVGVAVTSILAKEGLYRWTAAVAQRVSSSTLLANAWHHRSDAWSSVVAAVGVGASLCGLPLLDPLGGMLVAGLIGKQGVDMGAAALRELSDEAADEDTVAALRGALEGAAPGEIRRVLRLRTRVMGHFVAAEAELGMRPTATLTEAEMVRRVAAEAARRACPQVVDLSLSIVPHRRHRAGAQSTAVHVEAGAGVVAAEAPARLPRGIGQEVQRRVLAGVDDVARITHLRLHFDPEGETCRAEFEIELTDPSIRVTDAWRVASSARLIAEQVPEVTRADVHLELRDDVDEDPADTTRR